MNETEKRRRLMLEQMRGLYQDDQRIPAVHPRYRASYNRIYPEHTNIPKSTLGIRCVICVAVFFVYMTIATGQQTIGGIDDLQVRKIIMHNEVFGLY